MISQKLGNSRAHWGDPVRAWKFLQNNQGLYILELLREEGLADTPVILAYDFLRQERRYEHLRKIHPSLKWIGDAATPGTIRKLVYDSCR